jgi:hypothetical protein
VGLFTFFDKLYNIVVVIIQTQSINGKDVLVPVAIVTLIIKNVPVPQINNFACSLLRAGVYFLCF